MLEEYALIPDPDAWFERLGEEATRRVGELMRELAGSDPVGETFLEKLGRLNASKMQAEEIVRAQMLPSEPKMIAAVGPKCRSTIRMKKTATVCRSSTDHHARCGQS